MTQETLNQLTKLCEIDAMFINTSFGASEELGIAAIEESISSFTIFLTKQHGNFIPGMNIKYRTYIVGLLEKINDNYKDAALAAILLPKLSQGVSKCHKNS